ncbi:MULTISPECIES: hypothetical protein [Micromonospora]|uniref:Uncharacterized protein n=1 Tax=Micromonospora maris TaxID=1003110 RepID=A0A9X0I127_9ACTN|nr:hypothetical protein [Micromonospora maris]AEB45441.1 hypothetical protein VAB18032_21705 [Micromonospora maris AB-18-032]KUJ44821.1 hypothetical protein ADL17_16905 [Micromonospora maris]
MTFAILYLRSRRVPLALAVALGGAAVIWTLWLAFAAKPDIPTYVVAMTILLMAAVLSATLAGPDENLDRTASLRWPWRRALHLLAGLGVIVIVQIATLHTGARFGPAALVLRDAAGLMGLTALCTAVVGADRSWFLPLGWTTISVMYSQEGTWAAAATWQGQLPGNRPAALTATALAVGGLIAYSLAGPARREAAEYVR